MPLDFNLWGLIGRAKPAIRTDTVLPAAITPRLGRYGELYGLNLINTKHLLADEGSYFVAQNPTQGTGLANLAAQTSLSDTNPFAVIQNQDTTRRLYLDYIRLRCTAAGTNGTNISLGFKTDTINRYTSGGSVLVPTNCNSDDLTPPGWTLYAGAITAPAASAAGSRLISQVAVRSVIPVIGDVYEIRFGSIDFPRSSMAINGTSVADLMFSFPPVVLGPGHAGILQMALASQSAASSYEIEVGAWMR